MTAHDDVNTSGAEADFARTTHLAGPGDFDTGLGTAALAHPSRGPPVPEPDRTHDGRRAHATWVAGTALAATGIPALLVGPRIHRQYLALLMADIVGYTRLIEQDELDTALRVQHLRRYLVEPAARAHDGAIVEHAGDGTLISFLHPADAVHCAVVIQRQLLAAERSVADERRIRLRMGITADQVIVIDGALFGLAVNVAARLQGLAEPDGIYLTGAVADRVRGLIATSCEALGRWRLRDITEPVRVYRIAQSEFSG